MGVTFVHSRGDGVKIGSKLVHVVVECPLIGQYLSLGEISTHKCSVLCVFVIHTTWLELWPPPISEGSSTLDLDAYLGSIRYSVWRLD